MNKLTRGMVAVALVGLGVACATPALASSGSSHGSSSPRNDSFTVTGGVTSILDPQKNDARGLQIVSNTKTTHGMLTRQSDDTFLYTPDKGFHGIDSFTYSTSDAVSLYSTDVTPLGTVTGVNISGGAYGSSVVMKPGSSTVFYGLTDRGPNVDGPNGTKVEPLPGFTPAIGQFVFRADGQAVLQKTIPLTAKDGSPLNGLENTVADAGETITDLDGAVLPKSASGLDSEGLVAASDGSFWVSDEYAPFIVHFDRNGRELSRLSPYDGTLPAELKFREPNKGMEGLTLTPDGSTLVGIMQSALTIDPAHQAKSKNIPFTRIVTYNLKSHAAHEYAYVLDDPAANGTAVSEITAIDDTTFLVDERDGAKQPGAYKKIYKIDISKATDIGPSARVRGAAYHATHGLQIDGVGPLESLFTDVAQSTQGRQILAANGITPVAKSLRLDLGALVTSLDPTGGFFGFDKVEGIDLFAKGSKLLVSNDSDFGIDGLKDATGAASTAVAPPFALHTNILPNGQQDDGAYLVVDLAKAQHGVRTAKVTILVK